MELAASTPARFGLGEIGDWAARVERIGFDVIHISETVHDPFAVAALALQRTTRLTVRTSMALAFPRSPMITAYSAWDLTKYSQGRFQLGIASQVRGNIVGRFSSSWSEPVARLRDYINALKAIFDSFQTGEPLNYVGQHYRFDRLQPYFNPGPLDVAAPPIWTGGVNNRLCAMAGELADGFVCHPTNSHPLVLSERILPALARGASGAQHVRNPLQVVANPQPMMAATRGEVEAAREPRRAELAFLYSTPAYRRQLEHFGFGDVATALTMMVRRSEWDELSRYLTDDVMDRVVPQGTFDEIPAVLTNWYSGLCTGIALPVHAGQEHDEDLMRLVERCRRIPPST